MRAQPELTQHSADERRVFVAVAAAAGLQQLRRQRVEVSGNAAFLPCRACGDDVEVLEADRPDVGGQQLIEEVDDLVRRPTRPAPQHILGAVEVEPIDVPGDKR